MSARIPTFNRGVINAIECIGEGKALIVDQYWLLVGVCFVGLILSGMAPVYLLLGPMMAGISYCFLALKRGETIEFADLFKGFNFFGSAFMAGLIPNLPVLVLGIPAYLIFVVTAVLTAPQTHAARSDGAPPISVMVFMICWAVLVLVSVVIHGLCAFTYPLVVEWKLSGWDAVKLSASAVWANLGGIIALYLLCGLIQLGGLLLFGVGIFLALPLQHGAWTIAYRRIFPEYPRHLDVPPDPPKWREWNGETAV